jgi:hypothetical protein
MAGMSAYDAIGLFLVAMIAPFFWLIVLSVALWIGRRTLSPRAGRILFGHYWKERPAQHLGEERPGRRVDKLGGGSRAGRIAEVLRVKRRSR